MEVVGEYYNYFLSILVIALPPWCFFFIFQSIVKCGNQNDSKLSATLPRLCLFVKPFMLSCLINGACALFLLSLACSNQLNGFLRTSTSPGSSGLMRPFRYTVLPFMSLKNLSIELLLNCDRILFLLLFTTKTESVLYFSEACPASSHSPNWRRLDMIMIQDVRFSRQLHRALLHRDVLAHH